MHDTHDHNQAYVGYEYQEVTVPNKLDGLWVDSMQCFGWQLEKKRPAVVKPVWGPLCLMLAPLAVLGGKFREAVEDHASMDREVLTLKRERKISNKQELNRLQSQFEHSVRSIESLEQSKKTGAVIGAWLIGLVGAMFLALATFGYLAGMIPAFIAAAVPGFLGWILAPIAYRVLKTKKTKKVEPQIEAQHETIYTICEQAAGMCCAG